MTRLYLDLDGVMADFRKGYLSAFGHDPDSVSEDTLWANVHGREDFFRDLPICYGAFQFFAKIADFNPIILTACPRTGYERVAKHKREWVRHYLGNLTVLPVLGAWTKPMYMHAPGDILIDDRRENAVAWAGAGGRAILHDVEFDHTYEDLLRKMDQDRHRGMRP